MDWQNKIISLYLDICEEYKNNLWIHCQRFTNNCDLSFTDEEAITIFISGLLDGKSTIKQIYNHAKNYWKEWFPRLPTYEAYNYRLNMLEGVFIQMIENSKNKISPEHFNILKKRLIDSMPVIMAKGNRRFKAKVAPSIANKDGYCATKKLHYYGVKLHIVGAKQEKTIPIPEKIGLIQAGMSDIRAYEIILPEILEYEKFADKAYIGPTTEGTKTYTPVKRKKGQEFLSSADRLYSSLISAIRQPIESLFNWIEEKVKIQNASKVRSEKGLKVHVFGRLAAAFKLLEVKFSF